MNYFPKINRWLIPEGALRCSREEMARDGRVGNEGTALWLGKKEDGEARLTHLVFLRGRGIHKGPLNIWIDPELMREVHEQAERVGTILIGQIHSHDRDYGVGLSPTDRAYGVRVPYFLSVVYPDFASREDTTILDCGVHVFMPERDFVRLTDRQVSKQIIMCKSDFEVLIIGEP